MPHPSSWGKIPSSTVLKKVLSTNSPLHCKPIPAPLFTFHILSGKQGEVRYCASRMNLTRNEDRHEGSTNSWQALVICPWLPSKKKSLMSIVIKKAEGLTRQCCNCFTASALRFNKCGKAVSCGFNKDAINFIAPSKGVLTLECKARKPTSPGGLWVFTVYFKQAETFAALVTRAGWRRELTKSFLSSSSRGATSAAEKAASANSNNKVLSNPWPKSTSV